MCTRVTELKTRGITIPTLCCIINDLCILKSPTECNHYETYFTAPGLTEIKVISYTTASSKLAVSLSSRHLCPCILKCSSRALVGRRYGARADNKQTVDKLVDEDNHQGSGNGQGNLTFYVGYDYVERCIISEGERKRMSFWVCLFYPQVYSASIQDQNLATYYLIYKINTQHLITTSSIYPCAPIFTVFFSLLSRSWTNYWFLQCTATKSLSYQSHPIYWYSRSKANSFSAWLYPLVACFVVQKRTKF